MSKTHMASDETLQRIATAVETIAGQKYLEWDPSTGKYTDESIAAWLDTTRDGKAYGLSIPRGSAVACTKLGANAGIAAPTPGWVGHPAIDPYAQLGPFAFWLVNGYVDQVEKYLDKYEVKHVTEFVDARKNLTVTTLEYADKVNADFYAGTRVANVLADDAWQCGVGLPPFGVVLQH